VSRWGYTHLFKQSICRCRSWTQFHPQVRVHIYAELKLERSEGTEVDVLLLLFCALMWFMASTCEEDARLWTPIVMTPSIGRAQTNWSLKFSLLFSIWKCTIKAGQFGNGQNNLCLYLQILKYWAHIYTPYGDFSKCDRHLFRTSRALVTCILNL
jgi:hypothetical protein